mmetsp:Transcript_61757/g.133822  ORF Transcript_61757/g.133822 Transcript_61757/m.133822 type:complete len:380 (+) Transcript_61757:429-1568(+)
MEACPAAESVPAGRDTRRPPSAAHSSPRDAAGVASTAASLANWSPLSCVLSSLRLVAQKSSTFPKWQCSAPKGSRPWVRRTNCAGGISLTLFVTVSAAASSNGRLAATGPTESTTLMSCTTERVSSCGAMTFAALLKSSVTLDAPSPALLAFANASRSFTTSSVAQSCRVAAAAAATAPSVCSATTSDFVDATIRRIKVSCDRSRSDSGVALLTRAAQAFTCSSSLPASPRPATMEATTWSGTASHNARMSFIEVVPTPCSLIRVEANSPSSRTASVLRSSTIASGVSPPNFTTRLWKSSSCPSGAAFFFSTPGNAERILLWAIVWRATLVSSVPCAGAAKAPSTASTVSTGSEVTASAAAPEIAAAVSAVVAARRTFS